MALGETTALPSDATAFALDPGTVTTADGGALTAFVRAAS